ncbi:MAG: SGNH/GDSL hydrolase family protein [Actinomycetota bacterium]
MTQQRHPIMDALAARPAWTPATLTRVMQRISPAVRAVSAKIDPIEGVWHELAGDALRRAAGPDQPPLWIVLGDSTAQGVGASTIDHGWVARLDAALTDDGRPHALINLSRSGAHSHHVLAEQLPLLDLLPYPPSIVTVCCGANDLMRNPNPSALARRLRALAAELPAGTIMSTLPAPRYSPTALYVHRSLREAAGANDVIVADLGPHLVSPWKGTSADRYHPNDRGYGAWVRAFAEPMGIDADSVPRRGTLTSRRPAPSEHGTTGSG